MKESSHIIARSNISFGTSGARGLVTDLTPVVSAAFEIAFANVINDK